MPRTRVDASIKMRWLQFNVGPQAKQEGNSYLNCANAEISGKARSCHCCHSPKMTFRDSNFFLFER